MNQRFPSSQPIGSSSPKTFCGRIRAQYPLVKGYQPTRKDVARIARRTTRPTITDVARAAGVSMTTVSHALNGRGFVDPATRERVKEAARKLGYRPNLHAQKLRGGGAHTIVLLSSMPFGVSAGPSRLGFLMEVAAVAATAALTHGM